MVTCSISGAGNKTEIFYNFDDVNSNQRLNISIDIKTRQNEGIIFFVPGGSNDRDFFVIYLKESKV